MIVVCKLFFTIVIVTDGLSRHDWDDTEQSSHGTGVKRESTF